MARKDEFEFDIPSKKEKKEKPQREKKESKPLFGEGSSLDGLFKKSSSDDFEFSVGEKKNEKKEKPHREEKERKPLFGKDSFLSGLFNKAPSFDNEFSFNKEKKDKGEKSPNRLKWWHILLIVLGAILIVVGIIVGIVIGQVSGGIGSIVGGGEEEIPEPEGIVSSVGTFLPTDTQEYILCKYTEYFHRETMVVLQKANDVRYDGKSYYVLIEDGLPVYDYSGEYTGEYTQEETKEGLLSLMQSVVGYTDEQIALCDVHIYTPVSFTRVVISSASIADDGSVSIKYSAGAVDGEMSEEYTLAGTYTKEGNDYTFTYTNLPEDENLLRVAENLLGSAKYTSYAQYGAWVNELAFGYYSLYFTTNAEETP